MSSLPKRFPGRVDAAAVREEAELLEPGQEGPAPRRLAGRVLGQRGHGKLVFVDLVDRSGQIQLLLSAERVGPVDLDLGDIVGVEGRPTKTKRGEPSVAVDELILLAKTARPLPDTFHGLVDAETRYRKRYLDLLVNQETRRDFLLRSQLVSSIRSGLDEDGFVEVETPILQPTYGGAFAKPFVTHHNELDVDLYLRIASELYLKRLIVGGLERVYEIGKDFRNEGVSYKHQPEFTMLEWYEAYADYRDTMERIEHLVERVARETTGGTKVSFRGHEIELAPPWQRVKLVDALEEQGLWSREEGELRRRLEERGTETGADRTWAQLVDHALGVRRAGAGRADDPARLSDQLSRSPGRPTRTRRSWSGSNTSSADGLGNAFTELNDAAEQEQRFATRRWRGDGRRDCRAGRSGLRRGALVRHAPDRGARPRDRPPGDVLTRRDTIRDVILFPTLRERSP